MFTKRFSVTLVGLERGDELQAVISLRTVHPRCIDYSLATVTVAIDGCRVTCEAEGITDDSALTSVAQWMIRTFGAKAASISAIPSVTSSCIAPRCIASMPS